MITQDRRPSLPERLIMASVINRTPSAWPVAMALALAACAQQRPELPAPPTSVYRALGQEPGWTLEIAGGWLSYLGNYGTVRIEMHAPDPRATFTGHRYEAREIGRSLTVDVTHRLCLDDMSGRAFADTVTVVAEGREVRGCGGERVPSKDV